ncbi:DUF3515 domain-containing protein [Nocardioides piscis]|uniref:DUF3515 domain-containing protein n=1 Tax=Nocardioides piscis TaxID=2714938 RepID=A0A6G7YJU5_9ACTN|nr:DUF3515 domain-containing protein [Nocardioides piscis]QIK77007.1 DUF3515 domain-containing protein [Nocardioides piscis]
MSIRTRGVVVVCALFVAGCSGAVSIDAPDLSSGEQEACAELVAALPDTLAGEPRRDVTPADAPGAAWGEEPIVLTCGVELPSTYDEFASCSQIGDVGWFLPPDELKDPAADIVVTALTHSPASVCSSPLPTAGATQCRSTSPR